MDENGRRLIPLPFPDPRLRSCKQRYGRLSELARAKRGVPEGRPGGPNCLRLMPGMTPDMLQVGERPYEQLTDAEKQAQNQIRRRNNKRVHGENEPAVQLKQATDSSNT